MNHTARIQKPNNNTVVAWEGPSRINGEPVVVLLTGLTRAGQNRKTGAMLATYILVAKDRPLTALMNGNDRAVCGSCPLRPDPKRLPEGRIVRSCYVNLGRAPNNMYTAYRAGVYRRVTLGELPELCRDHLVRIGSYGDPAAVPFELWTAILQHAKGWTGYTHDWAHKRAQALKTICQASVDTDAAEAKARALGWYTFRVRPAKDTTTGPDQMLCPASAEAGKVTTCSSCLACSGTGRGKHVTIAAHGPGKYNVERRLGKAYATKT